MPDDFTSPVIDLNSTIIFFFSSNRKWTKIGVHFLCQMQFFLNITPASIEHEAYRRGRFRSKTGAEAISLSVYCSLIARHFFIDSDTIALSCTDYCNATPGVYSLAIRSEWTVRIEKQLSVGIALIWKNISFFFPRSTAHRVFKNNPSPPHPPPHCSRRFC